MSPLIATVGSLLKLGLFVGSVAAEADVHVSTSSAVSTTSVVSITSPSGGGADLKAANTTIQPSNTKPMPVPINPLPDGVYFTGCYNTTVGFPILDNFIGNVSSSSECIALNKPAGQVAKYGFAATTRGYECWAGNVLRGGTHKIDEAMCTLPCPCPSETCGCNHAAQVYTLHGADAPIPVPRGLLPGNASYYGCFQDSICCRALKTQLGNVGTVEDCVNEAISQGYKNAMLVGLEWGHECWVGHEVDLHAGGLRNNSDCAQPCDADSQETCGNGNAVQVYQIPLPTQH